MSAKTPEQIADEVMCGEGKFNFGPAEDVVIQMIRDAIETDRAQRNLIEYIAKALEDRGAEDAAQLVRDTDPDDDLWNNYVGPMLDSIEDDYTRMAREIKEATA